MGLACIKHVCNVQLSILILGTKPTKFLYKYFNFFSGISFIEIKNLHLIKNLLILKQLISTPKYKNLFCQT